MTGSSALRHIMQGYQKPVFWGNSVSESMFHRQVMNSVHCKKRLI